MALIETTAPEAVTVAPTTTDTVGVNRRGLLSSVGVGAAGALTVGALAATGIAASTVPAQAQSVSDADIVNFALNLEYLEAEFYLRAVTGKGLAAGDVTGTGTQGSVTGGSAVPFKTAQYASLAAAITIDEQAHVKFLRSALGSAAVAEPQIDFTTAFTTLALGAGLIVPGQTFNPFADEISFLLGAFIFEDVGVTAYGGAAALLVSKQILSYAASVLAVEAYHAGAIRANLYNIGGGKAVQAISNLRGSLSTASGGFSGDQGILKANGTDIQIAPVDDQAQTFRRTTTQVLSIVYGGPKAGLFFPNGMNGLIK